MITDTPGGRSTSREMLNSARFKMAANPLEDYLRALRDIRRSGSGVPETSYYPVLAALLDIVGGTLKPKVRCIVNPSHGAGIPDVGLFTPDQFQKASGEEPQLGTKPSRGVVEAKPTSNDAFLTADGAQVSKYWKAYRQFSSRISVTSCSLALILRAGPSSSNTTASRRMRRPFGLQRAIRDRSQPNKARHLLISSSA
jgi:hypothetical protein